MAEFVAALFIGTPATGILASTGAIITGPAATGLAAAGALSSFTPAAAGLFGAAGAFTTTGIVKGAFGLLSAASSISGGFAQSGIEQFQADEAELRGLEEGNRIKRAALEQEAANVAATRGSGLTLKGSGQRIEEELQFDANRELGVVRSGTERVVALRKFRGRQAIRRGVAGGAGTLLRLFS